MSPSMIEYVGLKIDDFKMVIGHNITDKLFLWKHIFDE
jgi:hypothetical protein